MESKKSTHKNSNWIFLMVSFFCSQNSWNTHPAWERSNRNRKTAAWFISRRSTPPQPTPMAPGGRTTIQNTSWKAFAGKWNIILKLCHTYSRRKKRRKKNRRSAKKVKVCNLEAVVFAEKWMTHPKRGFRKKKSRGFYMCGGKSFEPRSLGLSASGRHNVPS